MRTLIVYFALLGILLCPYNCAVRAASKRASINDGLAKTCCEHCRAKRPAQQNQQNPERPTPSHDGRTCICTGAVFNVSPRTVVDSLLVATHAAPAVDSLARLELPAPESLGDEAERPPLAPDGRHLRIVIHSFLF